MATKTGEPWFRIDVDRVSVYNDVTKDGAPYCIVGQGIPIEAGNIKRILKVDYPYVKTIIKVEG